MDIKELAPDRRILAHLIVPEIFSWIDSMITPFSTHFDMSKTANDIAHEMTIEASASQIPGNGSETTWLSWKSPTKAEEKPGQILELKLDDYFDRFLESRRRAVDQNQNTECGDPFRQPYFRMK